MAVLGIIQTAHWESGFRQFNPAQSRQRLCDAPRDFEINRIHLDSKIAALPPRRQTRRYRNRSPRGELK
jgi:hypothetical protein